MQSLEQAIKQTEFSNEQVKAHVNVLYTANYVYNKISAALKPFGLTHEQFNVLRILRGSHPNSMCQKEILARMVAPNSNVTLIVKKLVAKKWISVCQSERDKREYIIQITDDGLEVLKKTDLTINKDHLKLNSLSVSEAFHLNALLDKLRQE